MKSSDQSPYQILRRRLEATETPYREITHAPAASARDYHRVVGSRLDQQAKALLFRRYRNDGGKDYVVYALPGDAEADVEALRHVSQSSRLRLATAAELEQQTGCRFGELPPLGSVFDCELILDARLLAQAELYFNAGCLDRSFVVAPARLVELEQPLLFAPK